MATLLVEQPKQYPLDKMDVYKNLSKGYAAGGSEHDGSGCEREAHAGCHKSRRRALLTLVGVVFLLGMLLFAASYTRYSFWECTADALNGLVKRATGENSNDGNLNGTDSPFMQHKCTRLIHSFDGLYRRKLLIQIT
jgi:hypothetical protein